MVKLNDARMTSKHLLHRLLVGSEVRSKNESADELSLQIENQVVKSSDKLTIFGVTIDDKLTFSYHIKDISKRASQKVGVLLRLRNLIPCSAKLQL